MTEEQKEKRKEYCRKYARDHYDSAKSHKYYLKTKEEHTRRSKESLWKRKVKCLSHYSNGQLVCSCCKEGEIKFLSMDHIDGGGSKQKEELGGSGDHLYRWIVRNNFPTGFQVLCHNCNQAKGAYGVCPHKTYE